MSRTPTMWDVHEFLASGVPGVKPRWVQTHYYNQQYALALSNKRILEQKSTNPKGTFFVISRNGEKPLNVK